MGNIKWVTGLLAALAVAAFFAGVIGCGKSNGGSSGGNVNAPPINLGPSAPTNLRGTYFYNSANSKYIIIINWNDTSSDELGFKIEVWTSSSPVWTLMNDIIPADANTYFFYVAEWQSGAKIRIYAYSTYGNSGYSNVFLFP